MTTSLLLAAGEGRRFREAGYDTPKPLLPVAGVPLLARVAAGLPGRVIVVAHEADRLLFAAALCDVAAGWVTLRSRTTGPLVTALAARPQLRSGDDLVIAYCDVWLEGGLGDFRAAMRRANAPCGAVVFRSEDPRYGYADVNRELAIGRVVEKTVVSPWAVSGAFWFRSAKEFLGRARRVRDVAAGIPACVTGGLAYPVDRARLHDLGTPADYEAFLAREAVPA